MCYCLCQTSSHSTCSVQALQAPLGCVLHRAADFCNENSRRNTSSQHIHYITLLFSFSSANLNWHFFSSAIQIPVWGGHSEEGFVLCLAGWKPALNIGHSCALRPSQHTKCAVQMSCTELWPLLSLFRSELPTGARQQGMFFCTDIAIASRENTLRHPRVTSSAFHPVAD